MTQFIGRLIGESRDIPQDLSPTAIAAATTGSANDVELVVGFLPSRLLHYLPTRLPSPGVGNSGPVALGATSENRQKIEQAGFINGSGSAVVSTSAANYFDYRLNVWRSASPGAAPSLAACIAYYSMQVDTTIGAIAATGVQTATPASMTGIVPGMLLACDTSTTEEYIYVLSTTLTTFNAHFTKIHGASVALTSVLPAWGATPFIPALGEVNATSNSLIASGSSAFIPNSIYGIQVGSKVSVAGGGTFESGLAATLVASTALTATFTQPHSGTSKIGYYVATTSATAVTATSTTAIVVASAANIVPGDTAILQGTGADSAKTDTCTVSTVVGTTVTMTAAISATNSYSHPINITSVAYLSATTTTVANQPSQVLAMASTTGIAVGSLVALQGLVGNSATAAFTGSPSICLVQAVVTNTSITVSPPAVFTNAYAVIPFTATTFATAVAAAGAATVTLTSGTNFATGLSNLYVWAGTAGAADVGVVTAVSAWGATATFGLSHSGAYTITSNNGNYFELQGGDLLTLARVSSNGTGLASPVGGVYMCWNPTGIPV